MNRASDVDRRPSTKPSAWSGSVGSDGIACVTLWTSGTDTRLDGVVRMAAVRRDGRAGWDGLETLCAPFSHLGGDAAGNVGDHREPTLRLCKEFGLDLADLTDAQPAAEVWAALRAFVGDRPVITHDGARLETWAHALDLEAGIERPALQIVGLDDVAGLIEPGHLSSLTPAQLVVTLIDPAISPSPSAAVHPPHVLSALAELVARFQDLGPVVHALGAYAWPHALAALQGEDLAGAARLALILELVDRPRRWGAEGVLPTTTQASDSDSDGAGRLRDGVLSYAATDAVDEDDPLALLEPAAAHISAEMLTEKPLAADVEGHAPFLNEDLGLLDDIFKTHLPALFAPTQSETARASLYRASQHRVAEEVARCLGSDELLLVHAPTGTGKTLAYLLPALMWARRYDVRVGIATYTRALQNQAMEREVPRALAALSRAGLPPGFRVSVLKGREHSLCWRALRMHAPQANDDAQTWLAWTSLALFGIRDGDGDLDRFPRRAPLRMQAAGAYRSTLWTTLTQVRSRSGCCTAMADRAVCAADIARRRAERSHVVLTNQSFALARPEFFRRVIFDECEHLHDQAMSAWSHRVSFPEIRRVLRKLHEPGAKGARATRNKPPLDRLALQLMPGSGSRERLDASRALWSMAASALSQLESQVLEYERWRSEATLGRGESEIHGLFREYIETSPSAKPLIAARITLESALSRLDASLAQLAEELESTPVRRGGRLRRSLELARTDLTDMGAAIAAWLPIDDGVPRFGDRIFHDAERDVRGEEILSALVLLPGDALGRHYYPELASAAFVSATTRLGGSFDKAKSYLGLDRVAEVDDETGDFDRTAGTRRVTTFHAPEVFDYGRVLVGVPRGIPSVRNREAYIDFLARYLPWYAERTRGRMLVLFTSLRDVKEVSERAAEAFRSRGLPLFWQGMDAAGKEELSDLFRERIESTLLGVDTFWYGADFPGETLETLVIARLPYGVPDRYHHAQCAALGRGDQYQRIYMPRALAKFRQGFGRLMRTSSDRGVVLVLDSRITERRHRDFLAELPVERPGAFNSDGAARLVRGDVDLVGQEAFAHLGILADLERRGLSTSFTGNPPERAPSVVVPLRPAGRDVPREPRVEVDPPPRPIEVDPDDLPF